MKKVFKGLGIFILLLIIGGFTWVNTGLELPSETETVIEEVLSKPAQNHIVGDSGLVYNDSVRIWYESIPAMDSAEGTIILVMGYGTSGLQWTPYFCEPLRKAG